jgi:NAD(P)-dependent dehydrogenase (short-subunit alcohol dehydrogenase family)
LDAAVAGAERLSEQKVVLVTGSSSGFGALIVRTLARQGHHVFASMRGVSSRNADAAAELCAWAGRESATLDVVEMDVTSETSVQTCVEGVLARAGHIDIVVNNAGASASGPIEAFSEVQVEALYSLNVFGPWRVNKAVLPSMRRRRSGLLLHISSTLGRVLPGSGGLYPATKWALEGLTESLSYQVKAFGIDVVLLEPGSYPSPATGKAMQAEDRDVVAQYARAHALVARLKGQPPDETYRQPDPQEVADAVARLIDLPAGQRPLRSVVGPVFTEGVREYNDAYESTKAHLAEVLLRPDQAMTWGPNAVPVPKRPNGVT